MKHRSTTPAFKRFATAGLLAMAVLTMVLSVPLQTYADIYDQKIKALRHKIDGYQSQASGLAAKADTLQNAVAKFNNQIAAIQAKIKLSEAKRAELIKQIAANKKKLELNKQAFADTLGDMYVDGTPSPIEILASSSSISDYVDKQSYRDAMNKRLEQTINEIDTLQKKLAEQKKDVEHTLADQKSQQSDLAAKRAERNRLLAETQGKEAQYQSLIKHSKAKIADLRAQQIAANARFFGAAGHGPACGGGYPGRWCNLAKDSVIDDWGMFNRECVSYTAFRVAASGRHMPYWGGSGNANQWDDNARAAGIPVSGTPRAGDVAISNAGYYGHAMYVESVNGDGTINISQYNVDFTGTYSTARIGTGGLVFIHF
ncbi:MAG TPA: CHAP domain-containing protein [Candidatus Saccharimonadales bacterium]|nr:CHAP domain-containing protein [Candidatus Saccharimonadales bacterium]